MIRIPLDIGLVYEESMIMLSLGVVQLDFSQSLLIRITRLLGFSPPNPMCN